MRKDKIIKRVSAFLVLLFFVLPIIASAANSGEKNGLSNPLPYNNLIDIILKILQVLLGLVNILTLLMFILGGFMFITSAGNQERIKKGKDTLIWAVIGLVIITLSYTILKFIFNELGRIGG